MDDILKGIDPSKLVELEGSIDLSDEINSLIAGAVAQGMFGELHAENGVRME